MKFKKIDDLAISLLKEILSTNTYDISFYTIGVLLPWKDFYKLEYALFDDNTIVLKGEYQKNIPCYFFPIGKNIKSSLKELKDLPIYYIPERYINLFNKNQILEINEDFDYLYIKDNFLNLSGKRKRKIRNHINTFKNHYKNYAFEPINDNNYQDILKMIKALPFTNKEKLYEQEINTLAILNYKKFNLFGYILYVQKLPIAFTLAEIKNDTLYIHFEKNDRAFVGSGDMNRYLFIEATKLLPYKYINREEDAKDIGLRTSKMRLRPDELIKKYLKK